MPNYRAQYGQQLSRRGGGTRYGRPTGRGGTNFRAAGGTAIRLNPGSPAWNARWGAEAGGDPYQAAHQNYLANLRNPNRPADQYPTHEAGVYTQPGGSDVGAPTAQQPAYTPSASQPASTLQPAPTQQPTYNQQPAFDFSGITGMFEESMAEANRANEARYQQGLGLHGQIADIYAPGGSFGAGHEAQLERTKTRDVASAQQQMVSSGLWGTTVAAAIPAAWEETVGQPSRLALQDVQMGRYGEALAGQAGFMERRSDIGPDMGMFANLMQGASAGPMGYGGGYGGQAGGYGGQAGGQAGGARYGTPPAGGGPAISPLHQGAVDAGALDPATAERWQESGGVLGPSGGRMANMPPGMSLTPSGPRPPTTAPVQAQKARRPGATGGAAGGPNTWLTTPPRGGGATGAAALGQQSTLRYNPSMSPGRLSAVQSRAEGTSRYGTGRSGSRGGRSSWRGETSRGYGSSRMYG